MSADLMRRFLDIVEGSNDLEEFFGEPAGRQVLSESALTEGWIADRINGAIAKVQGRVGQPSPQVLAQVSQKAQSLYQGDSAAARVLARARALGRSPALLAAMVGICGAMIALAPSPAAAEQAAGTIEQVLSLEDVGQIAKTLQQHGIDCGAQDEAQATLPRGLNATQIMAAKCLKAIADYTFEEGANLSSSREMLNHIAIEGGIEKEGSRFEETITLKTADGKLTLAQAHTVFEVQNGIPSLVADTNTGVQSDLYSVFGGLSDDQQNVIVAYINQNSQMDEAAGSVRTVEAMLNDKGRDLCLLVASIACRGGKVASRVSIGPQGVKVA